MSALGLRSYCPSANCAVMIWHWPRAWPQRGWGSRFCRAVSQRLLEGAVDALAVGPDQTVKSVSMYYNAGHPGVEKPHYHVVLWHVPEDQAKLK